MPSGGRIDERTTSACSSEAFLQAHPATAVRTGSRIAPSAHARGRSGRRGRLEDHVLRQPLQRLHRQAERAVALRGYGRAGEDARDLSRSPSPATAIDRPGCLLLGASLPEHGEAPLAATAERLIGPSGIVILLAAAVISMLATLGGDLLATPRALFASARDGILPRRLASIHPRFHTPFLAIGLYAALGFVLAVSGMFETLVTLSSLAILLGYLATAAATLELRRRDVRATPAVFRLIGGPLIPLLAAAVIVWLLSQARREEWLSIAVLVVFAAAFYALRRTGRRLGRQPD